MFWGVFWCVVWEKYFGVCYLRDILVCCLREIFWCVLFERYFGGCFLDSEIVNPALLDPLNSDWQSVKERFQWKWSWEKVPRTVLKKIFIREVTSGPEINIEIVDSTDLASSLVSWVTERHEISSVPYSLWTVVLHLSKPWLTIPLLLSPNKGHRWKSTLVLSLKSKKPTKQYTILHYW